MGGFPAVGGRKVLSFSLSARIQREGIIEWKIPPRKVASLVGTVRADVPQEGQRKEGGLMTEVVKWKRRDDLIEDLVRMAKIPDENIGNIKKLNAKNLNRLCNAISKARGTEWKPYQMAEK